MWRIFVWVVSTYALVVGMVLVLFLLPYTLFYEERLAVIVNAAKDISISTRCFWESSFYLWALCLVLP